jgi:E3 ubiquitin-protein ligase BRE1
MATNILVEKAKEQNIQILQFQNQKLSEQLANLKQQISTLDGSVSKYEEEKKRYADTLLCVSRIWDQLIADVRDLCSRCTTGSSAAAAAAAAAGDPAAAGSEAAAGDEAAAAADEEQQPDWEDFDPYLKRLLARAGDAAAAQQKAVKRNVQDYQQELSDVEQRLHARARASQAALTKLLELLQARNAAAGDELARLRALAPDAALQEVNEQLQGQLVELQQQLDAVQALQRSTQALLKQSEDQAFEAGENLKSIRNDLADKEYALQAAQRKLQRLKQQQQGDAATAAAAAASAAAGGNGSRAGMPCLVSQPSGGGVSGDGAAGASGGGDAVAPGEPGSAEEELQAQVGPCFGGCRKLCGGLRPRWLVGCAGWVRFARCVHIQGLNRVCLNAA